MWQTWKWHLVVVLLFICSAYLRLETLATRPLWHDELYNHALAQLPKISDLIKHSSIDWEGDTPPLQGILGKLHYQISHWNYAVRLPSVEMGIFTPFMLAVLGAVLFDRRTGIIAGFLIAFSVYHIEYSQDARQYALLMLLLVLMFFSLISFFRLGHWRYFSLFFFTATAALYTHHFSVFYLFYCFVSLAGMTIYQYVEYQQGKAPLHRSMKMLAFSLCSLVVICLFYIPYMPVFFDYVVSQKEGNLHVLNLSWRTISEIVGRWGNGTRWTVLYLVLLCLGVFRLMHQRDISFIILPWFLLPFFVFSIIPFSKFFDVRFLSGSMPSFFLLIALGIVNASEIIANLLIKLRHSLFRSRLAFSTAMSGTILVFMLVLSLCTYSTFRKIPFRCSAFPWDLSVMKQHDGFCEKHLILNSLYQPQHFLVKEVTGKK